MGLMNLLTVGRSLSEARNQPHRYKLMNGALPTFGNPAGPALERAFEVGAPAPRERLEAESDRQGLETQGMKTDTIAVGTAPLVTPRSGWVAKVNPFRTEKPPAPRRAVQGELSLDKVKPVRNDLSDSDLELVTATQPPELGPAVAKGEVAAVPAMKASRWWKRISGLFGRAK